MQSSVPVAAIKDDAANQGAFLSIEMVGQGGSPAAGRKKSSSSSKNNSRLAGQVSQDEIEADRSLSGGNISNQESGRATG